MKAYKNCANLLGNPVCLMSCYTGNTAIAIQLSSHDHLTDWR